MVRMVSDHSMEQLPQYSKVDFAPRCGPARFPGILKRLAFCPGLGRQNTDELSVLRSRRQPPYPTLTTTFPKLRPSSTSLSAAGAFSSPSTTCSL